MSSENLTIEQELATELDEERKKVVELQKAKNTVTLGADFTILSKTPLRVGGIVLGEGIWNGTVYTRDAVKEAYEKLKDKKLPVLVEHGRTDTFKDKAVGEVEKWTFIPDLNVIACLAKIADETAIQWIEENKLKGFSATHFVNTAWDAFSNLAREIDSVSVSLTERPAVDFAIFTRKEEALSKAMETLADGIEGVTVPKIGAVETAKNLPYEYDTGITLKDKVKELEGVIKDLLRRVSKLEGMKEGSQDTGQTSPPPAGSGQSPASPDWEAEKVKYEAEIKRLEEEKAKLVAEAKKKVEEEAEAKKKADEEMARIAAEKAKVAEDEAKKVAEAKAAEEAKVAEERAKVVEEITPGELIVFKRAKESSDKESAGNK